MKKIILASQSPRRKLLLEWAEIPFKIVVQTTDESFPSDLDVAQVPIHIALKKANAVIDFLANKKEIEPDTIVLAADTIVVLNDQVINKPADRTDAVSILSKLSGQTHRVITGVVLKNTAKEHCFSITTFVQFHPLTKQQIEFYVDHYKPYDKAGAYAIQEWIGVVGIAAINGDFYNVMGLPVSSVVQALTLFHTSQ